MSKITALFCFLLLSFNTVVAEEAIDPTELARAVRISAFTEIAPGLEYRQVNLKEPRSVSMMQLRCDPKKVKFNLLLASDLKTGKKTASAEKMAKKFGQLAVINSSYFGHNLEILGYAERLGHVLNPDVSSSSLFSAFFYWDGGRAGLKQRGESLPKNVPVLFQSGPRLVWDSQVIPGLEKKAKANRSGVAIDAQGRVILFAIGSTSRVTLAELPDILLRSEEAGGVDAVRALNFDGGSSTQFYVKTKKKTANLPGFVHVPVFLGVSKR